MPVWYVGEKMTQTYLGSYAYVNQLELIIGCPSASPLSTDRPPAFS